MYGTVAHLRVKPGMEGRLKEEMRLYENVEIPGEVATYVYSTDADPRDLYLAVIFEDKESYMANADSPEQDERYRRMAALLETEPEWHDGEVIYYYRLDERMAA